MLKIYQLIDDFGTSPFLDYRYEGKEVAFHSLKGIEPEEKGNYLSTEHDVISDWISISRESLSGEFRESDTPCWEGHYEQFGLVMLNLANMCRYRKTHDKKWNSYFDSLLPSKHLGCCRFRRHRLKLLKLLRTVSD